MGRFLSASLLSQLPLSRGGGSYSDTMKSPVEIQLLTLDDWGLNQLTRSEASDLLEVIEDRDLLIGDGTVQGLPFYKPGIHRCLASGPMSYWTG